MDNNFVRDVLGFYPRDIALIEKCANAFEVDLKDLDSSIINDAINEPSANATNTTLYEIMSTALIHIGATDEHYEIDANYECYAINRIDGDTFYDMESLKADFESYKAEQE